MRVWALISLLALAATWGWAPPARTADVLAYPQWNADKIRTVRPFAAEDALVFDLRVEERGGRRGGEVTTSRITLASSFTLIDTGPDHTLDDHALCRTLSWRDGAPGLESLSCYAIPTLRMRELANRQALAKLIHQASPETSVDADPYWAEQELAAQDDIVERLSHRMADGTSDYRLGNETVVRLTESAGRLSLEEARWLFRYLANHQPVHPQVRREIRAAGALPSQLEIETIAGGPDKRWIVMSVSNPRRAKLTYPLPSGLESALRLSADRGDTPRERGIRAALAAIDGTSTIPRPSIDALLAAMKDAEDQHNGAAATMLFLQLTQQYQSVLQGPDQQAIMARLRPLLVAARNDSGWTQIMAASAMAGDSTVAGDRQAAASFLALDPGWTHLPFNSFRYVSFANLVRGSKDTNTWDPAIFKAMPMPLSQNYWAHIAAFPWSANTFKDAGDTAMQDYDMQSAWLAYDLGRAVDTSWRGNQMRLLSDYEDRLRAGQPDYF